jgi:hypothetical protein
MTRKRKAKSPEYAVSDEAAAYIADALMANGTGRPEASRDRSKKQVKS